MQTKSQSFRKGLRGWWIKAPYRSLNESGLRNALLRTELRNSYRILKMSDNWYTGEFYKVRKTSEIGEKIECSCDNPIILEFKDEIRDAFFLRELEPTSSPATGSVGRSADKRNGGGRPKGIGRSTVDKMLKIHAFLQSRSVPVYRAAIEKCVGFNITRPLMNQQSMSPHTITLESLGIVQCIKGERTWSAWILTEKGRHEGRLSSNH